MTERIRNQVPIERVISSIVRVETVDRHIGLEEALGRIGFEILVNVASDETLICVYPKLRPNSFAYVPMYLKEGGIFHIPKKDGNAENKEASPTILDFIKVDESERSVLFSFRGVDDPRERRFVRLQANYSRENWGSI